MWSFFWVLLIGGYWIIRLLNESGTEFAYQMRDAENNVKYDGLFDNTLYDVEIERLLVAHPYYFSKEYKGETVEEFELIRDDLYDIFGNYIEYVSGCGWYILPELITMLILSKSHKYPSIITYGVPKYSLFYANQPLCCGEVNDKTSYKSIIGLRIYKKIEENIREKYPDFTLVYHNLGVKEKETIQNEISVYHEISFYNQQRSRRLWDDEPLSPDTAPTPIAPPPNSSSFSKIK